jgi:glycerol-3-phosphate dehydrogenase
MFDVLIIGGGIVGASTAYALSKYRLSVAVVEMDNDVANGTTKANSAIIHAGYDPEPGTLMARFNLRGSVLARDICRKLDVPHRQCGSLVIAFSPEEDAALRDLLDRGRRNGVEGLELLDGRAVRALEPQLNPAVTGGLLAPGAMIVSPWEYALAMMETALRNGAELYLNHEVRALSAQAGGWQVQTSRGNFEARYVINAAGLQGDLVHNMAAPPEFSLYPYRGEYYILDKTEGNTVNHIVFQCPSGAGKGVLVAPTVHGNLIVGPNAEPPLDREDTATTAEGQREVTERALKSVPSLNFRAAIRTFAGNRASPDAGDFIIREAAPGFFDAAGIKSPGLSAAPAIGEYLAELLGDRGLALEGRDDFTDTRRRIRFAELSPREKAELAAREPAYGRIICRCETVTEGEILAALEAPIPPRSLDGVKRRCSPGMGRCQGGFCGPRVLELLADHYHLDPTEILLDKEGTYMLIPGENHGL